MSSRKLWGGRFQGQQDKTLQSFTESFSFDQKLWREDLKVLKAHVLMLSQKKILKAGVGEKILSALDSLERDIQHGKVPLTGHHEDIHSFIEGELVRRLGEEASLIRIGRSRNDTVITDLRFYLKQQILEIMILHHDYLQELVVLAERFLKSVVPGYSHFRRAQPIFFSFYLLSHFAEGMREREAFEFALQWTDVSTLGAGAVSGTRWPIDANLSAQFLGFQSAFFNALDAVSDRDFLLAFYFASSLLLMHYSRFCEDLILWSSEGLAYLELSDALCTGSSLMPQKKNPDSLELLRAKTGRMFGYFFSLFSVLKGLPMGYNRDLQEDKELLFDAVKTMKASIEMMSKVLQGISLKKDTLALFWKEDFILATDLADELVRRGQPFSKAHELVGKLVKYCEENGKTFKGLSPKEIEQISPELKNVVAGMSVEESAKRRESQGGTGEKSVSEALKKAKAWLAEKSFRKD